MVAREFRLPDPGEGLVEAEIVTWRVSVGDVVQINDILVEIETSKSIVELPSPYAGTVGVLLVSEGDTVEVGKPIIRIEEGVSTPAAVPGPTPAVPAPAVPAPAVPAAAVPAAMVPAAAALAEVPPDGEGVEAGLIGGAAPGGRVAVLVGYGPKTTEAKRRPRKKSRAADSVPAQAHNQVADIFSLAEPVSRRADGRAPLHAESRDPAPVPPAAAPLPAPGPAAPEPWVAGGAVLAKPPVRKLAKDLGVDLRQLSGSGPGGVISRDDVRSAAHPEPVPPESVPPELVPPEPDEAPRPEPARPEPTRPDPVQGQDVRVPIKGVRKATAAAMVSSAFTAPHVTEWVTCDVSATVELVARLKERREFRDVRISPLLIVAKAVCLALSRTPQLNSFWDAPANEIVLKSSVNLGIAAATPRGLVVPHIPNAQSLSLLELAAAINDVVTTAREGRTQPAAMAGGTFSLTNVGIFGVDAGTPILNPGESGILCLGQIARRPWVLGSGDDERIEPRWVTTLALSFDHRLADGEQGSNFLAAVAQILADPGLALLF